MCVSANGTTHHLVGAGAKQFLASVNSVPTQYQLVSSRLRVKKSPFRVTLQEKWHFGCLWLRSRIRAHNKLSEVEQLLGLLQLALCPVSIRVLNVTSNLHCKLKSTKVTAYLCLDKARFFVILVANKKNF